MSNIRISQLTKSYDQTQILKGIDLEIKDGEFTVLLGPSGCGKSTLLGAIAGLEDIDGGRIEIGGQDVSVIEASKRGIAMVFQSYALYPTMSVYNNMAFGLRIASVPKKEIEKRVAWAARLLHLEALLKRRPSQLSGGQRQRVAIGRALVKQAKVCLFDEPLSNLDAKLRTETRTELKQLHQLLRQTIVYVTHDQIEALTLATRIAVMNSGRIEQYASPEEIYERPASIYVASFVGSPSMNFFEGNLAAVNGNASIRVGTQSISLKHYEARAALTDGQAVTLGVRPENIAIASSPSDTTFEGELEFVEPMGSDTLGIFKVDGRRVSVRLTPAQGRSISGRQLLDCDVSAASLFDTSTTLRI